MTESDDSSDGPQQPAHDAFVDGRTDYEKLVELLGYTEGNHLDFKRELDLSKGAKLNFAKDVVAMSNTPPGGYILIGVDNAGKPCMRKGTLDRDSYDPAKLGDLVRRYVDGRIDLRVAIHDHIYSGLDHEIIVIFVVPHADGLPLPMNQVGNYPDPDRPSKSVPVFRQGEVPVREGAANVPLRHSHWPLILAEYARLARQQGGETAQALLREFIEERNQSRSESTTGRADIPLLLDMDEGTFASAVQALIESGDRGDVRLRQFLNKAAKSLNSQFDYDAFRSALDKWTIFCAQAIYAERPDLVDTAVGMLHEQYAELGATGDDSKRRLDIVIRIYAVGSIAIRQKAWPTIHTLALQPVPSNACDARYIYSSWIRHAQVDASRTNLMPDNRGGFLISAARELLIEHPVMRPDVEDSEIPEPAKDIPPEDILLNSLCQFDLAYCFVVAAGGQHNAGYYPSSAALKDFRAAPIAEKIVTKPEIRNALLPNLTDAEMASVLAGVYVDAEREAMKYSMWWDSPYLVRAFIDQHREG